jgi:hypothetical protein
VAKKSTEIRPDMYVGALAQVFLHFLCFFPTSSTVFPPLLEGENLEMEKITTPLFERCF